MDINIYYPYNIPFWSNINLISVNFINNENHEINIYFIKDKKIDKLAAIIFPFNKKKYKFPENSTIAVFNHKSKQPYAYIKLKDGWTYIYP
tara:strand:+ start:1219 stop:1491 length:273 start_codon:yes stop_codon:yes gene_type:complete